MLCDERLIVKLVESQKTSKKKLKKLAMNYYDDETLRAMSRISRKDALNWIEEANRFFYKARPKEWEKDREYMKKIGW